MANVERKGGPVMRLVDGHGLMECRVCGHHHQAKRDKNQWYFARGSWQCPQGCKPKPRKPSKKN